MAMSNHTGAPRALEQLIKEQRANLISAHAVQQCLYQVLLYADDEDAVIHAEAAHVVVAMMGDIVREAGLIESSCLREGVKYHRR